MNKYAIYRIHYGLDFLGKSIESIQKHVNKIFVFWSKEPWYKECQNLPPLNENVVEFCKQYSDVTVMEREYDRPDNQYKLMYDEICQYYPRPDQVLMMEPDMVWDHNNLNQVWELRDKEISFSQIEFWKNEEWYIKRIDDIYQDIHEAKNFFFFLLNLARSPAVLNVNVLVRSSIYT